MSYLAATCCYVLVAATAGSATDLVVTSESVVLTNRYVRAVFDRRVPALRELRALSEGEEGMNLISAEGVGLEFQPWSQWGATPILSGVGARRSAPVPVRIVANSSARVAVEISNVTASDAATSTWLLTLEAGALGVNVTVTATTLRAYAQATALRVGIYTPLLSSYAIYDDGVLQMMSSMKPYYGAGDASTLERFYALGGGGAVDVAVGDGAAGGGGGGAGGSSARAAGGARAGMPKQAVVYALGSLPGRSLGASGRSGVQLVMAGDFTREGDTAPGRAIYCLVDGGPVPIETAWALPWRDGWSLEQPAALAKGATWTLTFKLHASPFDYPNGDLDTVALRASRVAAAADSAADGVAAPAAEPRAAASGGIVEDDHRAILTAVYASSFGAIVSHQHAPAGLIVGGVAFPERIVDGVYNFFDPDTWQTAKAMSYTGNAAADREVKKILRTSGALICTRSTSTGAGACTAGQIPHHFSQPEVCGGAGDPNDCNCSVGKALPGGGQCPTYKVSVLLFTVTFYANLAHSLTRSP